MNIFQCAKAYVFRKPMKSTILFFIFVIIFLGELLGIGVSSVAEKGERDAFRFQGSAILIDSEAGNLTEEVYEKITAMEHVTGINNWKENQAVPVGMNIVKEHTGEEIGAAQESTGWEMNSVTLLAQMDVKLYSWFWHEKAVSIISGTYPSYKNQGIMIESRFAKQNNLTIGDDAAFEIQESGKKCTYKVCGIFQVDSEFKVTKDNTLGEGVFIYSPYNLIFIDYKFASETMGFESSLPYGCTIYVDEFESINQVALELRELLGKDADIYNMASDYLSNESGVVTLMKNYTFMIFGYVSIIGGIIMLLALTFYAAQYRRESGIYLALGCGKGRIILQYGFSMLFIMVAAFVIAGVLYYFTADSIIGSLGGISERVAGHGISFGENTISPYITPDLGQGFSLDLSLDKMVSVSNYFKIICISVGFLILSMVIPLYSIVTTKPKFLLSKN